MNNSNEILKRLERIEKTLKEQVSKPLNFGEACEYLNVSRSHLYHLTSKGLIPHYKPNGKMVYFSKSELDEWILRKPMKTRDQINDLAEEYLLKRI